VYFPYIGKRLVATGLDWPFSVFPFFNKPCNWQLKIFRISATATSGPVFCSWVQFSFGHIFGPVNWTCKHPLDDEMDTDDIPNIRMVVLDGIVMGPQVNNFRLFLLSLFVHNNFLALCI